GGRARPCRPRRGAPNRGANADGGRRRAAAARRGRSRNARRMKVAVLGGTGAFGSALARRLVEAGLGVIIGSRQPGRAAATAAELGAARGVANEDAVGGVDLVVLAVLASAALETAADLAEP